MVISFLNQKGGCGKTTLSIHIAAFLAKTSKVILVDADEQGSSTAWSNKRNEDSATFPVVSIATATVHKQVELMKQDYSYVIIDSPPRLSEIAKSIIVASDVVCIPVTPSSLDVWAAGDTVKLVSEGRFYKPDLRCFIVMNNVKSGTVMSKKIRAMLPQFNERVVGAEIPNRIGFAEAVSTGKLFWDVSNDKDIHVLMNELSNELTN